MALERGSRAGPGVAVAGLLVVLSGVVGLHVAGTMYEVFGEDLPTMLLPAALGVLLAVSGFLAGFFYSR